MYRAGIIRAFCLGRRLERSDIVSTGDGDGNGRIGPAITSIGATSSARVFLDTSEFFRGTSTPIIPIWPLDWLGLEIDVTEETIYSIPAYALSV